LLTVQAPPVAPTAGQAAAGASAAATVPTETRGGRPPAATATLETGLLKLSLYKHFTLAGDFGAMMTPVAGKPLHFTANGMTFAPLSWADPQSGPTLPYHMYVRRHEPAIVFGSVDTGVVNVRRDDGMTFLDAVWAGAPFRTQAQFITRVDRTATEWRTAGRITAAEQATVAQGARKAARG
jgi:hypothetical protein